MSVDKYKVGNKYNMLTIIKKMPPYVQKNGRKRGVVKVQCDCGNIKNVITSTLTAKKNGTMSCGCYHSSVVSNGRYAAKHNKINHPLYVVWRKMKERCYNKNSPSYKDYGGRGVKMCKSWFNDFERFYNDMIDGYKFGLQIDRVDNNGCYEPNNCRWATATVNGNNKRNNIIINYNGIEDTLPNTLRRLGLYSRFNYKKVYNRMFNLEWSFEDSISDL